MDHSFVVTCPPGEERRITVIVNDPILYQDGRPGMAYHAGEVKVIYDGKKIGCYEVDIKTLRVGRGDEDTEYID